MALNPVGPLPAATYWRRRATIVLAVLVVLLLGRSCLGGSDGGRQDLSSNPKPSATPSKSATPSGAPPAACPDSALKAEASTGESTYAIGSQPRLTLVITNKSGVACTRDMGSGAVEFTVFSGEDRVWSSDDCGSSTGASVVTLAPGASKEVTFKWAGKRSKPACAGSHEEAKPGTYRVVGRAGTLTSSGAIFRFHA